MKMIFIESIYKMKIEEMELTEILRGMWSISSPFIAAFLAVFFTYWFGVKERRKAIDITKEQKLNIVLSNLLNVWFYLSKLDEVTNIEKFNLPFPKELFPLVLLKSAVLNDSCFEELEKSISLLKEYDPISYFELEGFGNRVNYIRSNIILPTITNRNVGEGNQLSNAFSQKIIRDIEEKLRIVALLIDKKALNKINCKISDNLLSEEYIENLREEYIFEFYDIMMSLIPKGGVKPSLVEFINELELPETQQAFRSQLEILEKNEICDIMRIVSLDPYISIEDLRTKLDYK